MNENDIHGLKLIAELKIYDIALINANGNILDVDETVIEIAIVQYEMDNDEDFSEEEKTVIHRRVKEMIQKKLEKKEITKHERRWKIKMKLLMHTCCAPCSVYCIDELRGEGIEPTVYWFNPNIHPYTEYKARRDCLKEYTKSIGIEAIFEEDYGLREFCKNTIGDLDNRCSNYCYRVRLEQTAKYAKEHGYDAFTTTLLVSIYQNHEAIIEIAEEIAKKYGLQFLYRDFRVGFREGQVKARELGLYMQKYCGCVFSEEDRYQKQILKDKENRE